ncbi:MAG TPA: AtpZ/AtpI family protein [Saprospiraceae bacterium]|jgi:uncharacterized membrane protein YbjE (DUF340 family)|nr:AtpZ/AtpI family protein [Saprospiraceae bacterium]HRO09741.1 AtpZ/AtpI family protein [Saprospiraceae bacterium]HRP42986.1 AtpZ/AtpI family protein [Saprospiraceae bacterium]
MEDDKDKEIRNNVHAYLKYSGLAFQFAGVVVAGLLIGKWLDKILQFEKPVMTMLLILLFFCGYMYKLYVDLIRKQ